MGQSAQRHRPRAVPLVTGLAATATRPCKAVKGMQLVDAVTRLVFGAISIILMLLSAGLVYHGGAQVVAVLGGDGADLKTALLDAVGYTVIAIAVFDVAKYLLEEEAIRARELRLAGEARRSLTKFISTIAIAVFLEALVAVFEASKTEMHLMLYPTLLLLGGVALVIGLGVYQRLSVAVETEIGGAKGEARDEAEADAARDAQEA